MNEDRIIIMFGPLDQWRFLRESSGIGVDINTPGFLNARHNLGPPGSATIAFSTADGKVDRIWWLVRPSGWHDGTELSPLESYPSMSPPLPFKLVDARTIKLNEPSKPFRPVPGSRYVGRLPTKPVKLADRWAVWEQRHKPREILPPAPPSRFKLAWNAFLKFIGTT
jgi:hypothetical protein